MLFNSVIVGVKGAAAEDAAALARALAAAAGGARVSEVRVPDGESVGRGLHDAAVEQGADLIVIGSSTRGLLGRILAGDDVIAT
jgi:nucleotide-binding universal stress UspA family protein